MTDQTNVGSMTGPADQTRRWLWRVLILSLSVNILVAGIFIGSQWTHHSRTAHDSRDHGIMGFTKSLDAERRQVFQDMARSHRERGRELRKEVRSKQRAAMKLLKSVPYDRDQFVAALDEALQARTSARRELTERFVAMIDQMTDEERRAYADWYEDRQDEKLR